MHVQHGSRSTRSAHAERHHSLVAKVPLNSKMSDFSFWSIMLSRTLKFGYALVGTRSTSAVGMPRHGSGGRRPTSQRHGCSLLLAKKMRGRVCVSFCVS